MKKITLFLVLWVSVFSVFSQSSFSMEEVVRYLASPELEGRKIQTKGDTLAREYLVNQFENMGLMPFYSQYAPPFCTRSIFTAIQNEMCSNNVIAFVEGTDAKLKEQYILVCAHFDHVGTAKNVYFAGANDNASGTATVLYLADYFAKNPLKRSIIFACFAGEESGMLGSNNFIKTFPEPLNNIKYVINFDMVGRYDDGGLCLMGKESSKILETTVKKESKKEKITVNKSASLFFVGSDHYPFYLKNIPVLCFNTGNDLKNYHTPRDKAERIDFAGMETIAGFAKEVVTELGNNPKDPVFKKMDETNIKKDNAKMMWEFMLANPNKFGFEFDREECGNEIEITKTTKKGEEAGLLVGDIVIKINNKPFECSMDFMELVKSEKEKPYKVTVVRNGEEMVVEVN